MMTTTTRLSPRTLLLLFLLGAGLRLVYVLAVHPAELIWADEMTYDRIAWQLAQTGRYISNPYDATPVMPAFLALVYSIFGHSFVAARVIQALLGGVMTVCVALIAHRLFDRRVSILAGVGVAGYPPLVYMSGVFYAEHLAAVLLTGVVTLIVVPRMRVGTLLAAGVVAGVLALTRPLYLVLIPVFALYIFATCETHRWRSAIIMMATSLAIVLPWTARNYAVFHHLVPVSTGFGLQFWRGNNHASRGDADDRHIMPGNEFWERGIAALPAAEQQQAIARNAQLRADLEPLDQVEQDNRWKQEGKRWIRDHPGQFLKLVPNKIYTLHTPFSRTHSKNGAESSRNTLIAALSTIPVLLLGLPGMVIAFRRRRTSWILHAVILMPTLMYSVLTASTRFRLPLDAFWIILAGVTLGTLHAAATTSDDEQRRATTSNDAERSTGAAECNRISESEH